MTDKIEEIRDRVEQDVAKGPANKEIYRVHKDRAFLLAEVDRLTRDRRACSLAIREAVEEIKSLRAENKRLLTQRCEIERLRAEVDRLRKEMREIAEDCESEYPSSYKKIAWFIRNALEAKP